MKRPQHFLMRLRRDGPLVPARLRWLDHAPEDPEDNKLDRGRLSIVVCADVAGAEVPPEVVLDRLWSRADTRPGIPSTHWKYPRPITEEEYRYQLAWHKWSRVNPRRPLDPAQLPLPDFTRENSL